MWILLVGPSDSVSKYTEKIIGVHKRYKSALIRVAYRMLKDQQDAEDAAMTGMQKFIENADEIFSGPNGDDEDFIRHKIFDYVHDSARLIVRKRKRRPPIISIDDCEEKEFLEIRPDGFNEWIIDMSIIFNNLPERYREALEMTYLKGRNDLEIAKRLNTTPANVRHLRSRGLEKLRRYINDHNITLSDI